MLSKYLFKRKLYKLNFSRVPNPWSEDLLLHGSGIIHYCCRYVDNKIISMCTTDDKLVNIKQLSGLTSTNTDVVEIELKSFKQLTEDKKKLPCLTKDDFETNIDWIINRFKEWICYKQLWNDKYYLYTPDGSHHIAALYTQAVEQNRDFYLKCKITEESFNFDHFIKIKEKYDFYLLDNKERAELNRLVLEDHYTKLVNPIKYPLTDNNILIIKKNHVGTLISEYLKRCNTINLLDELLEWLLLLQK